MLGLPTTVRACLFDLDGVLTETAELHATAWKELFDQYLSERARRSGSVFVPFDAVKDYERDVDGKPREAGVRSFLATRGIHLSEGEPGDAAGSETIHGLAAHKNQILLRLFKERGVVAYAGSVDYLHAVRAAGLRTAVVSSSRNCHAVTVAAGIAELFDVRVDGLSVERDHLRGKPAPDTFVAAARMLGLQPAQCAVFEDALAGVEAGKSGAFGLVVGVDRHRHAQSLRAHGADVVVSDLAALLEAS